MWSAEINGPFIEHCIKNHRQRVNVPLADSTVLEMPNAYYLVNRILVNPIVSLGMVPNRHHLLLPPEDLAENGNINNRLSCGFRDAVDAGLLGTQERTDAYMTDVIRTVHGLHKLAELFLGSYTATISTKSILDAMSIPEVHEASQFDLTDAWGVGINAVETAIRDVYKRTTKALMETRVPNALTSMLRSRSVKADQLMMSVVSGATRTDINDSVLHLVLNPYLYGLQSPAQFAVDTRGARKAKMYSNSAIGTMQFAVRRQALRAAVTHVVSGDCGAQGIPFTITSTLAKGSVMLGKYYVDGGKLEEITPENIKQMIGKQIMLRSAMICRHADTGGVCHACGGRVIRLLQEGAVPSILSTSTALSPIGQTVLSTKHYFMTTTLLWRPPLEIQSVFEERMHCIYIKQGVPRGKLRLRVPKEEFFRYADLAYVTDPTNISLDSTRYFSTITKIGIESGDTESKILYSAVSNQIKPSFSMEYLVWLRDNLKTVTQDTENGHLILDVTDYPREKPIMHYFTVNDSVVMLIDVVKDLLEKAHLKYTSVPAYLAYAANALFGKLDNPGNLVHLEVILRAAMITSAYDPRVPVVDDPNHVMFGPIRLTIGRNMSALLGYQDFKKALTNPGTFLLPKDRSPIYDPVFGQ